MKRFVYSVQNWNLILFYQKRTIPEKEKRPYSRFFQIYDGYVRIKSVIEKVFFLMRPGSLYGGSVAEIY
jgi:hypothetical protein